MCLLLKKLDKSPSCSLYLCMESEENMCYWVCFECHIPAVDPYHLTDQWIIIERPLLFYSNGTIWVSCYCIRKLHLHCCADLPSDAAEEQLEIEHYICDYCGWFMP